MKNWFYFLIFFFSLKLHADGPSANLNQKFIADDLSFSLSSLSEKIQSNKNESGPYLELNSISAYALDAEWLSASSYRFAPLVGLSLGEVNYKYKVEKGVTQGSKKIISLYCGGEYDFNKMINFYGHLGFYQQHFLNQTATGSVNQYNLLKVVLTRFTLGADALFFNKEKWSLKGTAGLFLTIRKRINNLVIDEGGGYHLELLSKYHLSEKKSLGGFLKIENQHQRLSNPMSVNRQDRKNTLLGIKYFLEI